MFASERHIENQSPYIPPVVLRRSLDVRSACRLCSNVVRGEVSALNNMRRLLLLFAGLSIASLSLISHAAEPWGPASSQIDVVYPQVEALYLDLHRNPELSYHEEKTAAKIADQLRKLGYDVTTGFGGTGVVGVFKNGPGPVVMLRAELDALPVPEKTGLAYASHVTTHDDRGVEVPV